MKGKFDHQQEFPRMAHEVPPSPSHGHGNSIDDLVAKIKEMNTGYVAKEPTPLHPDDPQVEQVDRMLSDVKSPDHYAYGGIETIDYIKAKLTPEQYTGYLWGNVLKYISRFDKKEGIKDLKKAKVYIDWLVEQYDARLVYPNK